MTPPPYRNTLKVVFLAILFSVPVSFGQGENKRDSKVQPEIMKVDTAIRQAIVHADTAALDRLLVDEWIVTHTNGRQQTKTQFIEAFRSGRVRFEQMDLDDVKIRVFGKTAVLTARITDKVVFKGEAAQGQVRITSIYVKRRGQWRNLAVQATRIEQ